MWTSEAVSIVLLINNDYCFFLERWTMFFFCV
jgi:hypothetical protein